eukprot:6269652-Prymnesium_polylepis.1
METWTAAPSLTLRVGPRVGRALVTDGQSQDSNCGISRLRRLRYIFGDLRNIGGEPLRQNAALCFGEHVQIPV